LIEKMGDGAFSNVYKAIDRKTNQKCAIKVVRKYELNHSQVRLISVAPGLSILYIPTPLPHHLLCAGHARDQGGGVPPFCSQTGVCFNPDRRGLTRCVEREQAPQREIQETT
jgi:serine/threonine protein kinase